MEPEESSTSDHESSGASHRRDEVEHRQDLSWQQAYEAAYRYIVRYYDYERIVPILRLVKSISDELLEWDRGAWTTWQACVRETLAGAPLPTIPPPWA